MCFRGLFCASFLETSKRSKTFFWTTLGKIGDIGGCPNSEATEVYFFRIQKRENPKKERTLSSHSSPRKPRLSNMFWIPILWLIISRFDEKHVRLTIWQISSDFEKWTLQPSLDLVWITLLHCPLCLGIYLHYIKLAFNLALKLYSSFIRVSRFHACQLSILTENDRNLNFLTTWYNGTFLFKYVYTLFYKNQWI